MNMAKVEQCMKRGRSRKECMAEAYPDGDSGNGKNPGKKSSPKKSGGSRKNPPPRRY